MVINLQCKKKGVNHLIATPYACGVGKHSLYIGGALAQKVSTLLYLILPMHTSWLVNNMPRNLALVVHLSLFLTAWLTQLRSIFLYMMALWHFLLRCIFYFKILFIIVSLNWSSILACLFSGVKGIWGGWKRIVSWLCMFLSLVLFSFWEEFVACIFVVCSDVWAHSFLLPLF